jgi:hypothetical protein
MGTLSNIRVEPMVVTWGESAVQIQTITTVADVASSLNNKYFFLYDTAGVKHYFWFDVNSAGADPAIAGATAHEVDIGVAATAAAVATALETVLEAVSGFDSTVSDNVITVTHSSAGYAMPAHDGNSGFSFAVSTEGDSATDMGFIDGDIEIEATEDLVDVTAHEHGTNVLSQIRTGKQVQMTVNLKETSVAQIMRLFRQGGGQYTPSGAAGTAVAGWGTGKDFTQTMTQAKKLTLHPKVLGSSDKTRDYTFHLCYPILESFNFSGENIHMFPVSFKVYPKLTLNNSVEYFSVGDGTQTLT